MRRSSILGLRKEREVQVGDSDLYVTVVPSAGTNIASLRHSMLGDGDKLQLVQTVFVGFKGYTEDDGTAIDNSQTARLELLDSSGVFYAIQAEVMTAQGDIFEGEGDAASE